MKISITRYDRFEKTVQNWRLPDAVPVVGASRRIWGLICAFCIFAVSAQICLLAEGSNTLTVQLMLKDGYVRVDKSNTTVRLQPDFTNWFSLSKEKIQGELSDYLDSLFKRRGKLVEQLLTPDARKEWDTGRRNANRLDGWDRITTNWDGNFVLGLNLWIQSHTNLMLGDAKVIYDGLLDLNPEKALDQSYDTTPIRPLPEYLNGDAPGLANGRIEYEIVSVITADYVTSRKERRVDSHGHERDFWTGIRPREVADGHDVWPGSITGTNLAKTIENLQGQLWFRSKFERELTDYLESRGVPVEIQPPNSKKGPDDRAGLMIERPMLTSSNVVIHDRILFSYDPRLAGVFVRVKPDETEMLRKALYMFLPSGDFGVVSEHLTDPEYFHQVVDPFSTTETETNYMVHLNLTAGPGANLNISKQYITEQFLAERLRYLDIVGFSAQRWNGTNVGVSQSSRFKTAELLLLPTAQKPADQKGGGVEFVTGDVTDLQSLSTKLKTPTNAVLTYVSTNLTDETRTELDAYPGEEETNGKFLNALVSNLNEILHHSDLYDTNRFSGVQLRDITQELADEWNKLLTATNESLKPIAPTNRTFRGDSLAYFNRLLLEDAYAGDLATNRLMHAKFQRGTNFIQPKSFEAEKSHNDKSVRTADVEPDFPNFARVGVEYAPKQPLRYYASYTRAGLGGPNSLSGEVGWQDEPFGEASFTRDFFLFGTLEKRLQLSVRGFSDYQAERLLAGTEVDERRNGGEASANLDLLRDGNGHWLRLDLAGGYREVIVDRFGQRVESGGLATADLGFLYLYHWDGTPGSARLELQPNVRLGYANDGGNYYATPSLTATYHRFISSFNQWECHASGLWSSSETPLTELPSFGGETSVRGYRADAGTGRATWAIQNEFWFPLRYRFGLPESMDKIIRRNFAIAPFFDIGGIHDSTDGFSGVKLGAGVGLRFIYNDSMTLRLDWANAIDESDRKRGGSMFYFSVSTRQIL